jgi:hypothetical protein
MFSGSVGVPVVVSPASGPAGTTFSLRWASAAMSGYVFDVEIRSLRSGAKSWTPWTTFRTGTTTTSGVVGAGLASGTYEVHARLRNVASGRASDWSPSTSLVVGP